MANRNSQQRSPRSSAKTKQETTSSAETFRPNRESFDDREDEERYMDRSGDLVARVRAAKEVAQRKMEEFGDVSEYDITVIHGQLKEGPDRNEQPLLDFERGGEN